jgi:uncharacterized membrane protein (DUF485 family)
MGSQTPAAESAIVRGPEVAVALSLEGFSMLVWLAVILLVAWLLGWGVFHVAGGLIHLLLVIAVVVFLINFISGRRTV